MSRHLNSPAETIVDEAFEIPLALRNVPSEHTNLLWEIRDVSQELATSSLSREPAASSNVFASSAAVAPIGFDALFPQIPHDEISDRSPLLAGLRFPRAEVDEAFSSATN